MDLKSSICDAQIDFSLSEVDGSHVVRTFTIIRVKRLIESLSTTSAQMMTMKIQVAYC